MEVTIKFYGIHRYMADTESINMPIADRTTAQDAFDWVKRQFPGMWLEKDDTIILLNTGRADYEWELKDKDEIAFLFDTKGK